MNTAGIKSIHSVMTSGKEQARKSPSRTIRAHCHYCVQSRSDSETENCTGYIVFATGKPCPFYEYRLGNKRPSIKIMRQFCLDCMGGSKEVVKECTTGDCLIHPFRFGKNPALTGKGKCPAEMSKIRAMRRPFIKEISGKIERSATGQ
jgi:hypothetical protein